MSDYWTAKQDDLVRAVQAVLPTIPPGPPTIGVSGVDLQIGDYYRVTAITWTDEGDEHGEPTFELTKADGGLEEGRHVHPPDELEEQGDPSWREQYHAAILHGEAVHGCEHTEQAREMLGLKALHSPRHSHRPPASTR